MYQIYFIKTLNTLNLMFETNKTVLREVSSTCLNRPTFINTRTHMHLSLYILSVLVIGRARQKREKDHPLQEHIISQLLHILIRIKAAIIPRSIIWFSEHWTLICRGKYRSKKTSFNSWKTFLSPLPLLPSLHHQTPFSKSKIPYPLLPFIGTRSKFHHTRKFRDRYSWRWGWGNAGQRRGRSARLAFRLAGGGTELWAGGGGT